MSDDRLARIVAALETAATAHEGAENETPGHIPYRFTFPAIARELLLMTTEISPTERQAAVKSIHAVRKAAGTLLSLMGGVHLTVVDDVGLGLADVRAAERKARALLIAFLSGLSEIPSPARRGAPRKASSERIVERLGQEFERITGKKQTIVVRDGKATGPFLTLVGSIFAALNIKASPESTIRRIMEKKRRENSELTPLDH